MENAAAQKVEDGGRTDRISKLPKDILYHILYFMSKNEAARTCVLSKSWRRVWINRLKLTFDERSSSFDGPHRTRLFVSSVNEALQSYLDNHNIHRIEEFHLILMNNSESILLLEKWIPMLDATPIRELCLWILPKLGRKFPYVDDLPSAVFKSERLARLCLYRCKLSLEKIHFARLDRLRLSYVKFTERVFENIASSCPLITTMWFKECTWFEECDDEEVKTITLEKKLHKNLKHFTFINDRAHRMDKRRVEIHVTTLETIHVHGCTVQIHGNKFRNLKELSLGVVILLRESFDFSSRHEFPVLTSLRLHGTLRWEYLNLRMNAPELTSIRYAAQIVPAITFTSPISSRCTSDIVIFRMQTDPVSWLLDLHAFLQTISRSEIRLCMCNVLEFVERVFVENKPPVVVQFRNHLLKERLSRKGIRRNSL
ncbi:hypothetical protein MIMGU_mgv1a023349mg, partial [Erythranthe guttata]